MDSEIDFLAALTILTLLPNNAATSFDASRD
jgi:hypothetical protein